MDPASSWKAFRWEHSHTYTPIFQRLVPLIRRRSVIANQVILGVSYLIMHVFVVSLVSG